MSNIVVFRYDVRSIFSWRACGVGDWITKAPNINMCAEIDEKIGDICLVRLDLYFKKKKYYLRYKSM